MYELLIERHAERDLKRLSRENYERVVLAVQALAHNPRPSNSRKLTGAPSDWRLRVGDYRVLYEIHDGVRVVRVMRVRHRREAYR